MRKHPAPITFSYLHIIPTIPKVKPNACQPRRRLVFYLYQIFFLIGPVKTSTKEKAGTGRRADGRR